MLFSYTGCSFILILNAHPPVPCPWVLKCTAGEIYLQIKPCKPVHILYDLKYVLNYENKKIVVTPYYHNPNLYDYKTTEKFLKNDMKTIIPLRPEKSSVNLSLYDEYKVSLFGKITTLIIILLCFYFIKKYMGMKNITIF